jgi:integrase
MERIQKGRIYEASGAFYVQYRVTEIVDGKARRVQRSKRLCEKSHVYYSKNSKAVKLKRDEFMLTVNSKQASRGTPTRITDFWEQRYLPYCIEVLPLTGRPRKKASTLRGFKQIWRQHLSGHFGTMLLEEYEPHMGTAFLERLTGTQSKNTLRHIKALGSSIFKRAVQDRLLKVNPWHDVQMPDDAIESPATLHYTIAEAENIISALVERVDCQLIVALACFLGLRPGEIEGLRWEDFDSEYLHIRRSVVRGIIGTPKTAESLAALPLIDRVIVPLKLWGSRSGNPSEGWLFPSSGTLTADRIGGPELMYLAGGAAPMALNNIINRDIKPVLKAKKITWKKGGLYCGRRGAGTAIIERSNGNIALGQALLRHKDAATTTRFYKKQISDLALKEGIKFLE